MGLTSVVSSASSASSLSLLSGLGVGAAGIFVTVALVYLLAYLNIVEASERNRKHLRSLLVVVSVPLTFAFAGMILYESLSIIGFL